VIRSLEIRGLIVIEHADLELGPGLTVITGETGAGKSVLTNAFGLLGAAPADSGVVRPGHRHALIQATVEVPPAFWESLEEDDPAVSVRDLVDDPQGFTITRRIPVDGRARSLVDGVAVPRATASALIGHLMTFSGQGEQRALTSAGAQLAVLDRYCGTDVVAAADELARMRRTFRAEERAHVGRVADREDAMRRRDDLEHLVGLIDALGPGEGEHAGLVAERDRLRHADRLMRAASLAAEAVAPTEREVGARELVGQAERAISDVVGIDPILAPAHALLGDAQALIGEAAVELRRYLEDLSPESGRLDAVEGRLAEFARIADRAACLPDELPERLRAGRAELEITPDPAADERRHAEQRARSLDAISRAAEALSTRRTAAAANLAEELRASLVDLAMPDARVRVEVQASPDPLEVDRVAIFVQPNPGLPEAPLGDIASGGELSRVLLAVQGLAAGGGDATLVFDEIDAGIGGVTAAAVASRLGMLGRNTQTIAITHLAQVAAVADAHYVMRKSTAGDGIARTEMGLVVGDARIDEMCRMLGADVDDLGARQHAIRLLGDPAVR
jgi:DNA repair protein RecN (Recombination protein N)